MALFSTPAPSCTPPAWRSVSRSVTYVAKSHVVGCFAEPSHVAACVAVEIWVSSAFTLAASTLPAAAWKVAKDAMTAFCGITIVGRSVTRNGAYFVFSVNTTVCGSGAATDLTFVWMSEQKDGMKVQLLDAARSNVNFTSAEVKSSPFCHLIPGLRVTVQVNPSALTTGSAVAMSGTTSSLLLTRYMPE